MWIVLFPIIYSHILIFQAINIFGDKRNKEAAEKLAKEQELQKVHVKKEDIEVIVSCFETSIKSISRIDFHQY